VSIRHAFHKLDAKEALRDNFGHRNRVYRIKPHYKKIIRIY
jgi:hypothetical protein